MHVGPNPAKLGNFCYLPLTKKRYHFTQQDSCLECALYTLSHNTTLRRTITLAAAFSLVGVVWRAKSSLVNPLSSRPVWWVCPVPRGVYSVSLSCVIAISDTIQSTGSLSGKDMSTTSVHTGTEIVCLVRTVQHACITHPCHTLSSFLTNHPSSHMMPKNIKLFCCCYCTKYNILYNCLSV